MHFIADKKCRKRSGFVNYSQLSLNGHLYTTDTSVKRTPISAIVGPCLSFTPFI